MGIRDRGDPALDELLTPYLHQQLVDEIELLDGAAEEFDLDKVLRGELSPVFFGSALTNFGVEPFLENFLRLTPTPLARVDSLTGETVDPCRDEFSAFIFKIQANMNKAHRDRIAFMRICSGKFERGMEAFHVQDVYKRQRDRWCPWSPCRSAGPAPAESMPARIRPAPCR